jgi:hypothetical protein
MKRLAALMFVAVLANAPVALADEAAAPQQAEHHHMTPEDRAAWQAMTPDQRKAKIDELVKAREAKMTPDQKAAFEARRAKWQAMSPDERKAAREKFRQEHPRREHKPRK